MEGTSPASFGALRWMTHGLAPLKHPRRRLARWLAPWLALSFVALAGGCNEDAALPGGGPQSDDMADGILEITPPAGAVTVQDAIASFQFQCLFNKKDVSADADWKLSEPDMATLSGGTAILPALLPHGALVTVTCSYQGKTASATLAIKYVTPDLFGGDAPGGKDWFAGIDSDMPGPTIAYPFDGATLARNVDRMNLQWEGGIEDQLYRIHVTGDFIDSTFYVGTAACTSVNAKLHCQYQPPDGAGKGWKPVALSAAGQSVRIVLSAVAGRGSPVKESGPLTVAFSPEDVRGSLYYSSPSTQGVKRVAFGAAEATDLIRYDARELSCAGCHTPSRDGTKLAAMFEVPGSGAGSGGAIDATKPFDKKSYLIDPTRTNGTRPSWDFATFSPDGSLLLTNWAGRLTLRNGTNGNIIADVAAESAAVMPEWSPDGKHVVFVQLPPEGRLCRDLSNGLLQAGDWIVGNAGQIAVMPWDGSKFGTAEVIVPSIAHKEYHYYPSWSPDSQWVLFVTAAWPAYSPSAAAQLGTSPAGYVISYDQDAARLRLVEARKGATPIELTNATHRMNKATSWPKFAPVSQAGGALVFFTFSAKFDYGWVVTGGTTQQLWMSAIHLDRARTGVFDPSDPPFWLPFQAPTERNLMASWATN